MNKVQWILVSLLGLSIALFFTNVILDAAGVPSSLQPLQIALRLSHVLVNWAGMLGDSLAHAAAWVAARLTDLWDRLGPAFQRSLSALVDLALVGYHMLREFWAHTYATLLEYRAVQFLLAPEVILIGSVASGVMMCIAVAVYFSPWPRFTAVWEQAWTMVTAGIERRTDDRGSEEESKAGDGGSVRRRTTSSHVQSRDRNA